MLPFQLVASPANLRRSLLLASLFFTGFIGQANAQKAAEVPAAPVAPVPAAPPQPAHVRATQTLNADTLPLFLEQVRKNYNLPAVGAAIVFRDQISVFTVGVRKVGDATAVTDEDGWHLGSCTKSMTATMIAMLVDDGKLSWKMTLAEMLPDMAEKMVPEYRSVTLGQLLSHRAGLPRIDPVTPESVWRTKTESLTEQRKQYTLNCLSSPPAYPPGTKMLYSNAGFVIAGAIAEKVTGQSWEELMKDKLFEPLGMSSVTFGTQVTDKPVEPWPHLLKDGEPVPVSPGKQMELPYVLSSAGLVRCSLEDWGKYARFWLHGLRGDSDLLTPKYFRFLATAPDDLFDKPNPLGDKYAYGWYMDKRSWSNGYVLSHSGTNLMNYSELWLAPQENFAVLIVTNRGEADAALDDVAWGLVSELSRLSHNSAQ